MVKIIQIRNMEYKAPMQREMKLDVVHVPAWMFCIEGRNADWSSHGLLIARSDRMMTSLVHIIESHNWIYTTAFSTMRSTGLQNQPLYCGRPCSNPIDFSASARLVPEPWHLLFIVPIHAACANDFPSLYVGLPSPSESLCTGISQRAAARKVIRPSRNSRRDVAKDIGLAGDVLGNDPVHRYHRRVESRSVLQWLGYARCSILDMLHLPVLLLERLLHLEIRLAFFLDPLLLDIAYDAGMHCLTHS